jgi:hypothetical protein
MPTRPLGFASAVATVGRPNTKRTRPDARRLSDEQASALQLEYRTGKISSKALGLKYGVSQQTAYRIATGQNYADLPTAPVARMVDALPVRRRGLPSQEELTALTRTLKAYAGEWYLVKKTVRKPVTDYWLERGLEADAVRLGTDAWGLYVRWPKAVAVA